jgi:hypothetical protein
MNDITNNSLHYFSAVSCHQNPGTGNVQGSVKKVGSAQDIFTWSPLASKQFSTMTPRFLSRRIRNHWHVPLASS